MAKDSWGILTSLVKIKKATRNPAAYPSLTDEITHLGTQS